MRLPPPEVILSWPDPNYDNPETQGCSLLVIQCVLLPVALLCLVARLYARCCIIKKAGYDDWLMLAAMVFVIGTTIVVILASEVFGWKIHIWDLSPHDLEHGRRASIAAQTLYLFASGLAKLSILASYLRFAPLDSWFRRITMLMLPLVALLILTFLIVLWTQCNPASGYWAVKYDDHCIEEGPPLMAQAISSVTTDVTIYLLPLPTLRTLSLPRRQRVALYAVFSLGIVVVIAGSMRLYWIAVVVNRTYDVTWEGFDLWIWTAVEVNVGVICGCAPALRPLFKCFQSGIRRMSGGGGCAVCAAAEDGNKGEAQPASGGRPRPERQATWFGDLNWLEGPNWLGSLGRTTDEKDISPMASAIDLDGRKSSEPSSSGSCPNECDLGEKASAAEIP